MKRSTVLCPHCGSADLIEGDISYDGCITDYDRYGESMAWKHDGYKCKVCKTKFTIWEDDDDFREG